MGNAPADGYAAVLLVGFMAAGKTAVGRELARRTGWRLVDVDAALEARAGASVAELFAARGEAWFRQEEDRLTRDALNLREVVVVPGGGWAAVPGRLGDLPAGVLSVWLRVGPKAAVERAELEGDTRPLLRGPEPPLDRARALLAAREPHYAGAALHLDTEGRVPLEVADQILDYLRRGSDPAHPVSQ